MAFTTDLILSNTSEGRTKGSQSHFGTVLFILLSSSAQFSSVLIPLGPLLISRENLSVIRAAAVSGQETHF